MSKTKLALDVVQDLRSLADSLEALANAAAGDVPEQAASEPPTSTHPTPIEPVTRPLQPDHQQTQSDAHGLTIVELRAFVAERSTPQNRPKIKEILTRYGVKKLTELPEEYYAAVKAEVAKL